MTEPSKDFVTKDLCEERTRNICNSVDAMKNEIEKHRTHIDLTCAEIFRMLKEQNNVNAYNRGVTDTLKKRGRVPSTKTFIAIIAGINAFLLGIVELIKALAR